jgi:hypothetical protein
MSFVRQRAYPIRRAPIPVSPSTLYRWEAEGRITLVRAGAQTWITDEEIDRILSGEADLPTARARLPESRPQPLKRSGRPRKRSERREFAANRTVAHEEQPRRNDE